MTGILLVCLMMIIGAAIGGVTNSLAIKMLFRPYEAKYVGKWKVPFTPGLIPKRQNELAKQLGKTVVEHLLTPEGIKKKLQDPAFQNQVINWTQQEADKLMSSEESIEALLKSYEVEVNKPDIRAKVSNWTEKQYEQWMETLRSKPVKEVMTEEWRQKATDSAKPLSSYIQVQLTDYLSTFEAKQRIGAIVEKYLDGKGFLGNMVSSFLGNEGISETIHPILVNYIRSAEAKAWIEELVSNEINHFLDIPVEKIEETVGKATLASSIGNMVSHAIPLDDWLGKSVAEWTKPVKQRLLLDVIPVILAKAGQTLEVRMEGLLASLQLQEVVEKEVESFPLERIEALILNISRKEFKMITYLGAVLGGAIGIIQGIIVVFLG